MKRPRLCAVITHLDRHALMAPLSGIDFFELRMDLVGPGWLDLVSLFHKPWIATNRRREEGGSWPAGEEERIAVLLDGVTAGAAMVDIELSTPLLTEVLPLFKSRAECIVSYHNFSGTPSTQALESVVEEEIEAGADICKVVTSAGKFDDNITVMGLNKKYPGTKMVNFCMGETGWVSRILNPFNGGAFAYAALDGDSLSAPGQLTVEQLNNLYSQLNYD